MKIRQAFLTLLSFVSAFPINAQWEWQNPLPQGNDLLTIDFITENSGWAAGYFGTIIHTTDGGESWEFQDAGVQCIIYSIGFVDEQTGFAVGGYPYVERSILKTSDGGESWDQVLGTGTNPLYDLFIIDEDTSLAVGANGELVFSVDGGDSWQNQPTGFDNHFQGCWFFNSGEGWIVGDEGTILKKTANNPWISIDTLTDLDLYAICFTSKRDGWICGEEGTVFHTDDEGLTWHQDNSLTHRTFYDIDFNGLLDGWITGFEVLHTSDGGATWEVQQGSGASVCFLNATTGYTAGAGGIISRTGNGGDNWVELSSGYHNIINDLFFIDQMKGWAVEEPWTSPYYILHTNDGGMNWQRIDTTIHNFNRLYFIDELHGWGVSREKILYTSDGGYDWEVQLFLSYEHFIDVFFSDADHGWVLSQSDTLRRTVDGGNTWEAVKLESFGFRDGYFINQDTGWIVGYTSNILRTTNGGLSWTDISPGDRYTDYQSVCFTDWFNGWVAGDDNVILHTDDGGNTWVHQSEYYPRTLYSVSFPDSLNGWISGSYGEILHTNDGGLNWEIQPSGCWHHLFTVTFVDQYHGWTAGLYGAILHTGNGGIVGIKQPVIQSPATYPTIYPNPFGYSTTIEYSLIKPGFVAIDLFDHLGRHIETLMKEEQSSGYHQVTWDATNYPSGVYYYSLTTHDGMTGGKMLIVR